MTATLTIDTVNMVVTVRTSGESDLDRDETIDRLARECAARMAECEGLPHYDLDVQIGENFAYRERVTAAVAQPG